MNEEFPIAIALIAGYIVLYSVMLALFLKYFKLKK